MTLAAPVALLALVIVPAAFLLHRALERRRLRHAVRYPNLELLERVTGSGRSVRRALPPVIFALGLVALVVGLARPHATISAPREQATVIMVMDVSRSMLERDVRPNRLEAAKRAAQSFLAQLPDKFLVGLVAFSDFADVLTQPTTDRAAVSDSIDSLETIGRTAIGDAIVTALEVGETDQRSSAPADRTDAREPLDAVLLLSDGYQTTGRVLPLEAAARARAQGLPVFTIALGPSERLVERLQRKEASQQMDNPPDHDTLRRIARVTGGTYFSAPSSARLRSIYETLGSRLGFVEERQEVTFAFAAVGLVLTVAGAGLSALWKARFP